MSEGWPFVLTSFGPPTVGEMSWKCHTRLWPKLDNIWNVRTDVHCVCAHSNKVDKVEFCFPPTGQRHLKGNAKFLKGEREKKMKRKKRGGQGGRKGKSRKRESRKWHMANKRGRWLLLVVAMMLMIMTNEVRYANIKKHFGTKFSIEQENICSINKTEKAFPLEPLGLWVSTKKMKTKLIKRIN